MNNIPENEFCFECPCLQAEWDNDGIIMDYTCGLFDIYLKSKKGQKVKCQECIENHPKIIIN